MPRTLGPCHANSRFRSRLHVAIGSPGYVPVTGCGLQVARLLPVDAAGEWCDICCDVRRGLRRPKTQETITDARERRELGRTALAMTPLRMETAEDAE